MRKYRIPLVVAALILGASVAAFGGSNWHSHCDPKRGQVIDVKNGNAEVFARMKADYEREVAETGKDAVVSFPLSVALTIGGGVLAAACFITLVSFIPD